MSTAEKRIAELEAALAEYVHLYGMTDEARRLLVTSPWKPYQRRDAAQQGDE